MSSLVPAFFHSILGHWTVIPEGERRSSEPETLIPL